MAEQQVIGRDPAGTQFVVPRTSPPWNYKFWAWTGEDLLAASALVYLLPFLFASTRALMYRYRTVSLFIFVFWRLGYNLGIGLILHNQSKSKSFSNFYNKSLSKSKFLHNILKHSIVEEKKDGNKTPVKYPDVYYAWLSFRLLVDLILGHDFASYCLVCLCFWQVPEEYTLWIIFQYVFGVALIIFSIWAKWDAYRVIKDYAWYWGDFFFLIDQNLTFDRVFSLSPHPMYTIGYSFMYGASLLSRSYTILYAGMFGHMAQLVFLSLVENPHIEKTYGLMSSEPSTDDVATERGWLSGDLILVHNFDFFRSSDLFALIIVASNFVMMALLPDSTPHWYYIANILFWRVFQNVVLGYALHLQSLSNWLVERNATKDPVAAFDNWKRMYNLSSTMQIVAWIIAVFALYKNNWEYGLNVVVTKHLLGIVLIALHFWVALSIFSTVGTFGWFFGDFFTTNVPMKLSYQGIYRFLNNPDSIVGFAGMYGCALLCESLGMFVAAIVSQAIHFTFVQLVEKPHMKRRYGDTVRLENGVTLALKQIIDDSPLPQLKEKVQQVKAKVSNSIAKLTEGGLSADRKTKRDTKKAK